MKLLLLVMFVLFVSCSEEVPGPSPVPAGRCIDAATAIAEGFDLSHLDPKHNNCAPTSSNPDKCFCVSDKACHTASKCK